MTKNIPKHILFFIFLIYYFISIEIIEYFLSTSYVLNYIGKENFIFFTKHSSIYYKYYNIFSIISLIIIYKDFQSIFAIKEPNKIKKNYSNNISLAFNIVILVCLLLLSKDIYSILKFILKYVYEGPLENFYGRNLLYSLINNRKTHLNILIIISVANFKSNPRLSYLSYLLVLIYDFITLSRIDIFILLTLHYFTNLNIYKKKNIYYYLFFLSFILIIIFYRYFFLQQNFIRSFFADAIFLKISSQIFFSNIFNSSFYEYIFNNIYFFLNDFFYANFKILNFFILPPGLVSLSTRGIDSIVCYLLVFLIYYYFIYFLIKNFCLNNNLIVSSNLFILIALFRGNSVHTLGFIIKLYLLIIFLQWVIKNLQSLKFKAD